MATLFGNLNVSYLKLFFSANDFRIVNSILILIQTRVTFLDDVPMSFIMVPKSVNLVSSIPKCWRSLKFLIHALFWK